MERVALLILILCYESVNVAMELLTLLFDKILKNEMMLAQWRH